MDFEKLYEGKGNRFYDEWDKWGSTILEKALAKAIRNKEKKLFLRDFQTKKGDFSFRFLYSIKY